MNEDQVKGVVNEAAGKVQKNVGKAIGSTTQQLKGIVKEIKGKAQKRLGDVKEAIKDSSVMP